MKTMDVRDMPNQRITKGKIAIPGSGLAMLFITSVLSLKYSEELPMTIMSTDKIRLMVIEAITILMLYSAFPIRLSLMSII